MGRKKGLGIPGVSFSLNRAIGVTKAKQQIARATGIPTTHAGRTRKFGMWRLLDTALKSSLGRASRETTDDQPSATEQFSAVGRLIGFLLRVLFLGVIVVVLACVVVVFLSIGAGR